MLAVKSKLLKLVKEKWPLGRLSAKQATHGIVEITINKKDTVDELLTIVRFVTLFASHRIASQGRRFKR
jgi:hypothetical protein